eukprot:1682739-Amphidinium_carterae.7
MHNNDSIDPAHASGCAPYGLMESNRHDPTSRPQISHEDFFAFCVLVCSHVLLRPYPLGASTGHRLVQPHKPIVSSLQQKGHRRGRVSQGQQDMFTRVKDPHCDPCELPHNVHVQH